MNKDWRIEARREFRERNGMEPDDGPHQRGHDRAVYLLRSEGAGFKGDEIF